MGLKAKWMDEAKRRKQRASVGTSGRAAEIQGRVRLDWLPASPAITSDRLKELGEVGISPGTQLILKAFRATVDQRAFLVGFVVGDAERVTAIGNLTIERLAMELELPMPFHVAPVTDSEIAWDLVLRHLRTFTGKVLLFAFSDSSVYDAGTVEIFYAPEIELYRDGNLVPKLDTETRRRVRRLANEVMGKSPIALHPIPGVDPLEQPPIFEMRASNGKHLRATVWNGRRDFIHEIPPDIIRSVGGDRVAIVQVDRPVGVDGRSSVALTDHLAEMVDGVVHWARDTATYQSVIRDFIPGDMSSVLPPILPPDWSPEIILMPINDDANEA